MEWIKSDVMQEEVIEATPDRDRLMVGTIDRLNDASRRTAERAGRLAVLEEVFLPLR